MKTKIKEYKDKAGEWRINQTASNGKIVDATTEGYKNKLDAIQNRINASIAYLEHYENDLTQDDLNRLWVLSERI